MLSSNPSSASGSCTGSAGAHHSGYPHNPAAAALTSALRALVQKLARSPNPRLSCLYNVKQLDRIPPGSRAEANGGVIVPRYRGDVHSDMVALVAMLTLTQPPPAPHSTGGLAGTACRMLHVRSDTCLSQLGKTSHARNSSHSQLQHMRRASGSRPGSPQTGTPVARGIHSSSDVPHHVGSARRAFGHLRNVLRRSSPYASTESLQALSASGTSEPQSSGAVDAPHAAPAALALHKHASDLSEQSDGAAGRAYKRSSSSVGSLTRAQWRWRLLAAHARAVCAEMRVRRSMWHAAVRLARKAEQAKAEQAGSQ